MAFEFKLPELGENIEQAEIVKVLVSEGDKVEVDQILLEIETDKATVEVPAEKSGVVKSINVKDGDTVKVGTVILTFEEGSGTESNESQKVEKEESTPSKETKKEETEKSKEKKQASGTINFELPELGENIETADITKVLVSKGDKIEKDQVLFEIETDKATVEVPAEFSGTIKEVKVKEGDKVKVGSVVLVVESKESSTSSKEKVEEERPKEEPKSAETKSKESKPESKTESVQTIDTKESLAIDVARKKSFPDKIAPAAPSVRLFAREIGVNINEVNGTGPGGRISIDDVKKYSKTFNEKIKSGIGGMGIGIKQEKLPDFSKWGNVRREAMSNVRRKTAEHLSYAWATIPHVTQFDKADITEIENLRKQFAKKAETAGGKLTVTAILLKIVAAALKVFPQFNASVDMDNKEIVYKEFYNIGVAVDTEKGLIVPVIRDVDKKNILQLSAELTEISVKARDKKVTIEDMQGGCFTISNLGGIGGTYFTPIVNSPEVAILGVSRGTFEQVYKNDEFVPRIMLPLSLSYDHRLIDGADAARFIRWVAAALEQPFLLSLEG